MPKTRKLTLMAMLTALSLIVFVIEAQIPAPVPIPGVKLGIANMITLVAMLVLGRRGRTYTAGEDNTGQRFRRRRVGPAVQHRGRCAGIRRYVPHVEELPGKNAVGGQHPRRRSAQRRSARSGNSSNKDRGAFSLCPGTHSLGHSHRRLHRPRRHVSHKSCKKAGQTGIEVL